MFGIMVKISKLLLLSFCLSCKVYLLKNYRGSWYYQIWTHSR